EMMSEKDIQTVTKIFSELNKNPMLAEAFVKEANETTLTGNTTTLLGKLEQVLTKTQGKKAAQETIADIKENLKKNVAGRNPELWSEFDSKTKKDSNNIKTSTTDKIMNKISKNPLSSAVVGIAGLGLAGWGAAALIGAVGLPVVAGVAGVAALGFSIYNLCSSKD
ncbi:MAG: hypothetical protein WCF95_06000, partial [bacterium]